MSGYAAPVSKNVETMTISAIKEMAILSARTKGAVSLAWGLPSFRTPESIRRLVEERLETDEAIGMYALPDGLPELRRLVAAEHLKATGVAVDPERNVMITAGNMQGINALLHALLNPGDEVIVTDPGFASHIQQIRLCGGEPVYLGLDPENGWRLDIEALPGLITNRTRAIILVSPSNPTGRIFREATLRELGRIAKRAGIVMLLDDPYSHFTYENRDLYFNLSSVADLWEHTAYLFTFSKTHAMSGWRVGYMIVPEEMKRQVLKVHDATIICAPRIAQVAALAALTLDSPHLLDFESILDRRRALICQRLDRVPHVFTYTKPEGAYYVFPRIVAEHQDSYTFSIGLLEGAGVSVTPGSAFGPRGEHHVRMAYCVDEGTINEAFDRIETQYSA